MAIKPVKFISDISTKRQIVKTDINGNVLFQVSGTLENGAVTSYLPISGSALHIDGYGYIKDLNISGSALDNLNSAGPIHNVYEVFAAINNLIGPKSVNETVIGFFDVDGTKNIQLTKFKYSDLEYVTIDAMVKSDPSPIWKNDLISIELSGNMLADKLHVLISAPALTNTDYYRIIANKQTGSL